MSQADESLFESLSHQIEFCELLGRIADAIDGHPTTTGGQPWALPVQVLADHLDQLGHHTAADNVRRILVIEGRRWQAEEFSWWPLEGIRQRIVFSGTIRCNLLPGENPPLETD